MARLNAIKKRKPQNHKEGTDMEQILKKAAGADKQFPLIEVMVVMAAIGILVTIALQKFLAN
jgi:prepilin-type N-terminal cleavage/methylation domain-containing protein